MDKPKIVQVPYSEGIELVEDLPADEIPFLVEQLEAIEGGYPPYSWGWRPGCGFPQQVLTCDDIYERAEAYFQMCTDPEAPATDRRHITVCGLALSLGFTRDTMLDYMTGKHDTEDEKLSVALKKVNAVAEEGYERNLHDASATGSIFALKNMGWRDQTAHEFSGPGGKPIETRNESAISDDALKSLGDAIVKAEILNRK